MAIGNSTNAALLAVRILGAGNPRLLQAMNDYLANMEKGELEKVDNMAKNGWGSYTQL